MPSLNKQYEFLKKTMKTSIFRIPKIKKKGSNHQKPKDSGGLKSANIGNNLSELKNMLN